MSRYPFPSYPRGWFAVALSHELEKGQVKTCEVFGQELVLFRTEQGHAHALEPFCPHLGAHLGHKSCVEQESLRCGFHGFRFGGDGQCVEVPGGSKIPPSANTSAWNIQERNGAILAWYDPEGAAPSFDVPGYEDEEGWAPLQWHTFGKLATHPQETNENSVDLAHFPIVHGYENVAIVSPITTEGPMLKIGYSMERSLESIGMPGQSVQSVFKVNLYGLGVSVVEIESPTFGTRFRTYVYCTPIDKDRVILRGGGNMQSLPDEGVQAMVNDTFFKGFVEDVQQDFEIWENKRYLDRPVLAEGDGPVGTFRRWCKQFYVDASVQPRGAQL